MKLVMFGPPGAGKGTQAEFISLKLDIPTISTGAMIRTAVRNETPFGKLTKSYIDRGELVPDDVIVELVKERTSEADCKNGYVLDGFPRTIPQAETFLKIAPDLDRVISLEVPDDDIVIRLSGRCECKLCGAPYHKTFNPSKSGGKCEKCGGEIITRPDDVPELIKNRLNVYHEQTEPLKNFYESKGLLLKIAGNKSVPEISNQIFEGLDIT